MDALKIALETVFVGVLALPWLALAAQLFFPQFSLSQTAGFEGWIAKVWLIKSEVIGYAVVGVLSVAMAYTLGASVSRLAQDFFNDDDLVFHFPTEDRIRTDVYCDSGHNPWIMGDPGASPQGNPGTSLLVAPLCDTIYSASTTEQRNLAMDHIQQIFHLQETTLLLTGEDKVSRLRLLHQQIMVLQGAAFDGLLAWVLCLLGWNAQRSWGRWRWLPPIALLLYGFYALMCHYKLFPERHLFQIKLDDPPFMEGAVILLGAAGWYLAVKGTNGSWLKGTGWVSLLLATVAYSGWYWTEIMYDRLVIYSYYASQHMKLLQ